MPPGPEGLADCRLQERKPAASIPDNSIKGRNKRIFILSVLSRFRNDKSPEISAKVRMIKI